MSNYKISPEKWENKLSFKATTVSPALWQSYKKIRCIAEVCFSLRNYTVLELKRIPVLNNT